MNDQQNSNQEITLKEVLLTLKEYWFALWRNWLLILLIALPFVAYFYYKAVSTPVTYGAEVRFIIEGQSGNSFGGLGGLLGSFGLRGNDGKTNPFKILEVAKSNVMVGDLIFSKSEFDSTLIANKIIELYKFDEKWKENHPQLVGLRFSNTDIENLPSKYRSAFLSVVAKTIGTKQSREDALLKISLSEENGIFAINARTEEESLSLDLANQFYEKIKFFFEEQVLVDQKKTRDLLKTKADSINSLMSSKMLEIARFDDRSIGLISKEREYAKTKKMVEIQGLSAAYAEALKTYELADYKYKDQKPLFLTIDKPYAPLLPFAIMPLLNIFIGLILGIMVGVTFVIGRKIVQDALKND